MSKWKPPPDNPWAFLERWQWSTDNICFYFNRCREWLRRMRKRKVDPFPEPVTPIGCECSWNRDDVLAWAARNKKLRVDRKIANDNEPLANNNEHSCPTCGAQRQ